MRLALLSTMLLSACNGSKDDAVDDVDLTDIADTDTDADADSDTDADADTDTDSDADVDVGGVTDCMATLPTPPTGELCTVTGDPDSATHILLQGDVLGDLTSYLGGDVLVQRGANGLIECVGCGCAAQAPAETLTVSCPDAVVSPGLINSHDHITYSVEAPGDWGTERFDHRHDWRLGLRGHTDIPYGSDGSDQGVLYGELRMLLGGATSIAGSGSAPGLLRNLDNSDENEGLGSWEVGYSTFPLGDSSGTLASSGCGAYNPEGTYVLDDRIYLPHIAEGIDEEAENEFRCLSGLASDGVDLVEDNTSIIHGVGLDAVDVAEVANNGAHLVWSPRSNISLYGETAAVVLYANMGVPIALGTDWMPSGSGTVLRELQCADSLNRDHYGGYFDDRDLWLMVTRNAGVAMGADGQLGRLREGFVADITVFAKDGSELHRAVLDASIDDVELVLRGSEPMTGDADVMQALLPAASFAACEALEDCVSGHVVCMDGPYDLSQILSAVSGAYDYTICTVPADEPSCVPLRDDEDGDGLIYPTSSPNDLDEDGIDDALDNCPTVFNPGKPLDGYLQGDADGDGMGDACDPCPLNNAGVCNWLDPDADGIEGLDDNCPADANPTQVDADGDLLGDACDPCPTWASATGACPESVYDVKQGLLASGSPVVLQHMLVTGGQDRGVFAQLDASDPSWTGVEHSGIWIYMPSIDPKPQRGDIITIEGAVLDFFDQWQLDSVTSWTLESSGHADPPPVIATAAEVATSGSRAWELEGVVVQVDDVSVTALGLLPGAGDTEPTNEFEVDGSLRVNDWLYLVSPFPALNENFASLRGVLRYANDDSKLEPRDAADALAGDVALAGFTPTSTFLEAGTTTSALLSLSLTRPAGQLEVVSLACAPANRLTCPGTVTFDVGEQLVPVEITGVSGSLTPASITATLGTSVAAADVLVYDDTLPRSVVSLVPSPLGIAPDGIAPLTVTLDLPAASTGTVVDLSTSTGLVTVPPTVTVLAGDIDAAFDVTAGPAQGTDVVTATIGASFADADVDIDPAAVGVGLIFSEYLEGSTGNNKFVEIKNVDAADIDLSGCTVKVYSNGSSSAGSTINLDPVVLGNGDLFLLCNSTTTFTTGAPCDQLSGSLTFNGDDAVELACGATVYDVIGEIGFDPGTTWGTGAEVTADGVLRRDCSIAQGDADGSDPFDPAVEWVGGTMDDASNLGLDHCP